MSPSSQRRQGALRTAFRYESVDIAPGLTILEHRRRHHAESPPAPRRPHLPTRHPRA